MINYTSDEATVQKARENFIKQGIIPTEGVHEKIISSWQRCREAGIDPEMKALPPPEPSEQTKRARHLYKDSVHWRNILDSTIMINELAEELGMILIFFDYSGTAVLIRCSREIDNELRKKNIIVGTNCCEMLIGTNATGLTLKTKKPAMVVGSEHYISALSEYASFAHYIDNGYYNLKIFMLVAPLKSFIRFPNRLIKLSYILAEIYDFGFRVNNYRVKTDYDSAMKALQKNNYSNTSGIMSIENHGVVVYSNEFALRAMGLSASQTIGFLLTDICPPLESINTVLSTARKITGQEVTLNNQSYLVDYFPYTDNGEVSSVLIIIRNEESSASGASAQTSFPDLIGSSAAFNEAKSSALHAATSKSSILIVGESGTGKDLFAQSIHNASSRMLGPYIVINCAAIPQELMMSELFGYEEGSFTGAKKKGHIGKFESANGGTIFLDEIGELTMEAQAALLRVLENKEVTRVGSNVPRKVDIRIISATNADIEKAVMEGRFRLDLFFRINTVQIELPPLRDRHADILPLAHHFLNEAAVSAGKRISGFSPQVEHLFLDYRWPGNIRELKNVVEHSVYQSVSEYISLDELPKNMSQRQLKTAGNISSDTLADRIAMQKQLNKINCKEQILQLLLQYNGNKSKVARQLGISRATLYKRLKEMGI